MSLQALLRACQREDLLPGRQGDIRLRGLSEDSRSIKDGFLFAAYPGTQQDGRDFIDDALRRGAIAILTTPDAPAPRGNSKPPAWIGAADPRPLFAQMAAAFYPRRPERIVAVTGTNGKSSCVWFLRRLWNALNLPAAAIGTLGVCQDNAAPQRISESGLTTLAPAQLHHLLQQLADTGIRRVALEASSHGLAQHRLDGLQCDAAAFTSFSQDHLDYHDSMQAYAEAKLRLLSERLAPGAQVVLNADMPLYEQARAIADNKAGHVLTVGFQDADFCIRSLTPKARGQRGECAYAGKRYYFELNLVGAFQASNAIMAAALVVAEGHEPEKVFDLLSRLDSVPGRLQEAGRVPCGAPVYVDYAHTPDALANVLDAARPHVQRKLWLVFGCGGDRDRSKRAQMGAIAADKADHIIVTDDNPRTEDAAAIRSEIRAACPQAREIGDRRIAIGEGVAGLENGDILIIAGKGQERFQLRGTERIPFDDIAEAQSAIAALREGGAS